MRRVDYRFAELGIASVALLIVGVIFLGSFVLMAVSGTVEVAGTRVPLSEATGAVARPLVGSILVTLLGVYLGLRYRNDRLEYDDATFRRFNLLGRCVVAGTLRELHSTTVSGQEIHLACSDGSFTVSKAMRNYGAFRDHLEGSPRPKGLRFPSTTTLTYNRSGLYGGGGFMMCLGVGMAALIGSQAGRNPETALRGYLVAFGLGLALLGLGLTLVLIGKNWQLRVTPQGIEMTNALGRTLPLLPTEEIVDLKTPGSIDTRILICGVHSSLSISSGVANAQGLCHAVTELLHQRAALLAEKATSPD